MGEMLRFLPGLPWGFAVAVPSAMSSFAVVVIYPFIQIGLKLFDSCVNFLSESDLIKFLEHRFVKPLTDAVGLRASRFGFRVVKVFDSKIKLKLVMLAVAAILRAAIG